MQGPDFGDSPNVKTEKCQVMAGISWWLFMAALYIFNAFIPQFKHFLAHGEADFKFVISNSVEPSTICGDLIKHALRY